MGQRIDLQSVLENIVPHVYFQPPETMKLVYPCIVYSLDNIDISHADNLPYKHLKKYQITIIDKNPDSSLPDTVSKLRSCRFSRHFTVDNLHHFAFTIYY